MNTVRIQSLKSISSTTASRIRSGQKEAALVWTLCRDVHREARTTRQKWPSRIGLQKATKGRFNLHSQTIQMICHAFLANVETTKQLKKINPKMRYPCKDKTFYPLLWPAQAMTIYKNRIVLPMGRGRSSIVLPRPEWLTQPSACKIVWNGRWYELHVTVETNDNIGDLTEIIGQTHAAIDLGQIHQLAVATNTGKAIVVSGRDIRSQKRLLSKQLGTISQKRSKCTKGSRRWRKLSKARSKRSLLTKNRVKDLRHKGTHKAIDFCIKEKVSVLYIGDPDGVRNNNCGRHHNQRMNQWEYGKDISYLSHKSEKARIMCFTGTERGTSSRCPVCGHRHKPKGRDWRCKKCGFTGHRDIVGAVNMHEVAFGVRIAPPEKITYLRPDLSRGHGGTNNRHVGGNTPEGRSSSPDTGLSYDEYNSCLAVTSAAGAGVARVPIRDGW